MLGGNAVTRRSDRTACRIAREGGGHELGLEYVVDVTAVKVFDGGVGSAAVGESKLLLYRVSVGTFEGFDPA